MDFREGFDFQLTLQQNKKVKKFLVLKRSGQIRQEAKPRPEAKSKWTEVIDI